MTNIRKIKNLWYRTTHGHKMYIYDKPKHVEGAYFNIMGQSIVYERRWYAWAKRKFTWLNFFRKFGLKDY